MLGEARVALDVIEKVGHLLVVVDVDGPHRAPLDLGSARPTMPSGGVAVDAGRVDLAHGHAEDGRERGHDAVDGPWREPLAVLRGDEAGHVGALDLGQHHPPEDGEQMPVERGPLTVRRQVDDLKPRRG